MQSIKNVACSWSGGKDSCYALMKAIREGMNPRMLINVMNENGKISRSHGIPLQVLKQQAEAMGLPLLTVSSSWQDYEYNYLNALLSAKSKDPSIEAVIFGDIDLEPHREWEENICRKAGLEAILPLWQNPRKPLVLEMIEAGIETMIVSCNSILGEKYLGRKMDKELVEELEAKNIDACGENGEFHTLVVNCPLFSAPLIIPEGIKMMHNDYYFLQLAK